MMYINGRPHDGPAILKKIDTILLDHRELNPDPCGVYSVLSISESNALIRIPELFPASCFHLLSVILLLYFLMYSRRFSESLSVCSPLLSLPLLQLSVYLLLLLKHRSFLSSLSFLLAFSFQQLLLLE